MKKITNTSVDNTLNTRSIFDVLYRGTKFVKKNKSTTILNNINPMVAPAVQILLLKGYNVKSAKIVPNSEIGILENFATDLIITIDCDTKKYLDKIHHGKITKNVRRLMDEELKIYRDLVGVSNCVNMYGNDFTHAEIKRDRDNHEVIISITNNALIALSNRNTLEHDKDNLVDFEKDKIIFTMCEYAFAFAKHVPEYVDECEELKKTLRIIRVIY